MLKKIQVGSLLKKAEALAKLRVESNDVSQDEIKREIDIYKKLAGIHESKVNPDDPYPEYLWQENLRMAASLGDLEAKYLLGRLLIERGKFWDKMQQQIYKASVHSKYAREAYDEGFVYLKSAHEEGYFLAGRYLGLCSINQWGVEQNIEAGFKLVIDSINDEGAFDKATQIFEELGLNKPEFFSYMISSKQND